MIAAPADPIRGRGDSQIRILRVITRLNIGGPAIHAVDLSAKLDPGRFRTTLVVGKAAPQEGSMLDYAGQRGVEPVVIPEMGRRSRLTSRDVVAFCKLSRLIREERPHVVHTHTANAGFLGRLAARLAGVPLVVHTFHGHVLRGYYGPVMTGVLRAMERGLARLTDRIVAVSETVKSELLELRVGNPDKIRVVPLGLDLSPFLDNRRYGGEFRRELGHADGPLVGIVGRLYPIKNHRLFLECGARIARAEPGVRFVIVGDGPLREELEAVAGELGIADRVTFTGWRRDLPRVYADLDALVVSSDREGTPVAAIEAMASGCPVVATRVGGVPDLLEDGVHGLLVPPCSPDELAEAIRQVLADPDEARRMAAEARERVRKRHGLGRLVEDTESLYRELLASKGLRV